MDQFHLAWWTAQGASLAAIGAVLMGLLPVIAVIVPVVFYTLQVIDHPITQRWLMHRKARRIKRLQEKLRKLDS